MHSLEQSCKIAVEQGLASGVDQGLPGSGSTLPSQISKSTHSRHSIIWKKEKSNTITYDPRSSTWYALTTELLDAV